MPRCVLSFQRVTRWFGSVQIGPVSFEVRAGERVALRAANGSGKTTVTGFEELGGS